MGLNLIDAVDRREDPLRMSSNAAAIESGFVAW
jgi:hypothetical protein